MQPLVPQPQPSRDDIAALAYQIWEKNGRPAGQDVEFWLQAERSLLSSSKPQPQAAAPVAPAVPPPQAKPSAAQLPAPRGKRFSSKPAKGGPGPLGAAGAKQG